MMKSVTHLCIKYLESVEINIIYRAYITLLDVTSRFKNCIWGLGNQVTTVLTYED